MTLQRVEMQRMSHRQFTVEFDDATLYRVAEKPWVAISRERGRYDPFKLSNEVVNLAMRNRGRVVIVHDDGWRTILKFDIS